MHEFQRVNGCMSNCKQYRIRCRQYMKPSGAHISEQSKTMPHRHQRLLHKNLPSHMLPECSKILGALIAVEIISFPCQQGHGISPYSDRIQFWLWVLPVNFLKSGQTQTPNTYQSIAMQWGTLDTNGLCHL